jgi:ABC-type dipeptide/oligopeptide/nickel transport system permease subunit
MKIWPLITSLFILTIVCSPVLAISASELISSHRTGSSSFINIPDRYPSITPTAVPSPYETITPLPTRDFSSIFELFSNRSIFAAPTIGPRVTPTFANPRDKTYTCPPDIPVGELAHCKCSCTCFVGYECDCNDPKTGFPYPLGTDRYGRTYLVKEGCPAKWAVE